MEIDSVNSQRATLTNQERQRRRANNLCLYCGNPDHIVRTCPVRPAHPTIAAISNTTRLPDITDPDPGKVYAQRQ